MQPAKGSLSCARTARAFAEASGSEDARPAAEDGRGQERRPWQAPAIEAGQLRSTTARIQVFRADPFSTWREVASLTLESLERASASLHSAASRVDI